MQTRSIDIVALQLKVALERDENAYRELFYHFYTMVNNLDDWRAKRKTEEERQNP